jgi:hypothetical protein
MRRDPGAPRRADRVHLMNRRAAHRDGRVLARYTDWMGRSREVLAEGGLGGSVLVVDRDSASRADRRLLAHLGADEPPENAVLVCEDYLVRARNRRLRCRALSAADRRTVPFVDGADAQPASPVAAAEPIDDRGRRYRLERLQSGMSIPELRWCEHPPAGAQTDPVPRSVRAVIAQLQDYEPVRAITLAELARRGGDCEVSTTVLRAEMERVQDSPIVLNRKLRETVLETIKRQGVSMSEIAIRCGRVKRDCAGNESGETSWLARRLGILPEGGRVAPTPWVHSDVLGLIARDGLGISPREVEM